MEPYCFLKQIQALAAVCRQGALKGCGRLTVEQLKWRGQARSSAAPSTSNALIYWQTYLEVKEQAAPACRAASQFRVERSRWLVAVAQARSGLAKKGK